MMRSMFTAVSGLKVHQTKMDVIANNIANVNTVGYKSSRVTFADVFSQNIQSASGGNPISGRGGVNAMQIGLGATVASIDKIMTQGASQRTDSPFDLMLQGDAFFVVSDASGKYFTRNGAFNLDKQGNLVNSVGMKVQGWKAIDDPANPGQQIVQPGPVSDITIGPDKQYIAPTSTTAIEFSGNLNPKDLDSVTRKMAFYDSIGNRYEVDMTLKYDEVASAGSQTSVWNYTIDPKGYPGGDRDNPIDGLVTSALDGVLTFNTNGELVSSTPVGANGVSGVIDLQLDATLTNPASTFSNGTNIISVDFNGLKQYLTESTSAKADYLDGNYPGVLSGVGVGTDGKIIGRYSNGDTKTLGQIAVASFRNPAGLESVGNNLFVTTANSGEFDGIGTDVQSGGGSMQTGVLEMSNVDLSSEFTEMITTQRGFQANSRVITTSDDMLQELVNLKR